MKLLKKVLTDIFLEDEIENSFDRLKIDIRVLPYEERSKILYRIKMILNSENNSDEDCYYALDSLVRETEARVKAAEESLK